MSSSSRRWPPKALIARGIREGYRSGLEDVIAEQLRLNGIEPKYEKIRIRYLQPSKFKLYTPDFLLPNGIIVETKGRFVSADRAKHLLIKQQYPDLDIRFVFTNPNARLSKRSKTTYAQWCEKHGFKYAHGAIPEEWFREPPKPLPKEGIIFRE